MAEFLIIAGPNGAGKTTFAKKFLPMQMESYRFFNADEIARELNRAGVVQSQIDLQAGREMLRRIRSAALLGEDIMIETTLSSSNWARHMPDWRACGYRIVLFYLSLPSADTAVARVWRRVATGGHAIPEEVIRRRFGRSLVMLERTYKPIVDTWYVFNSLEDRPPEFVGSGERHAS